MGRKVSAEAWERVAAAVRAVEGAYVNESARSGRTPRTSSAQVVRLQVTGPAQAGLYPCTFQSRDVTQTPRVWVPLGAGWAEGPNGETLDNSGYYVGVLEGVNPADGTPVAMVTAGASSGGSGALWSALYGGVTVRVDGMLPASTGGQESDEAIAWAGGIGPFAFQYAPGKWQFKIPNTQPAQGYYRVEMSCYILASQPGASYGATLSVGQIAGQGFAILGGECNGGPVKVVAADTVGPLNPGATVDLIISSNYDTANEMVRADNAYMQYLGGHP